MRQRCENPESTQWPHYGGRGIKVCERWASFENFLADMGEKPTDKRTLDRLDNAKGYEPGNCRWATAKEQMNNQRRNRLITYNGRTQTMAQWSAETGIKPHTILARLSHYGWTVERTLTTPGDVYHRRNLTEVH